MDKLNILLLGSGGRECALAWKLAQSPRLGKLWIAPGNGGTDQYGTNMALNPLNFEDVGRTALELGVNMVIVGSEDPLVAGIADYFAAQPELEHIMMIGPSKAGAQLEGSKAFAKEFMHRHGIPTAAHFTVTASTLDEGKRFLATQQAPFVLKASGLAAGKGVVIIDSLPQAEAELEAMLNGKFGHASDEVVIEQFLQGVECSVFVLTDGQTYRLLPVAKDYKRVGEGDTGPNTGGMGSISPVPFADEAFLDRVRTRIVEPTIAGLKAEQLPYCGFIFLGLMNVAGDPYVIEYNVRMGDPETQSVMPRLKNDLVDLLEATATGRLAQCTIQEDPRVAASVIMTSGGYPGNYEKGKTITGLEADSDTLLFHAGTKREGDTLVTSGGRVLAVTAFGPDLASALRTAYARVESIHFDGAYYRRDIGQDLMA